MLAIEENVLCDVTRNRPIDELPVVSPLDRVGGVDIPGSTAAPFEQFAQRQFRPLVGLAYALCGDRSIAPELAQDALMAAFAKWDSVSGLDSPEAWVRRVVANRATSVIRRRVVETRGLLRLRSRRQLEPMAEPAVETEWLWALVRELPRRQRQVVALHYVERYHLDEIAEVLDISKASANTHLRRARDTLAGKIDRKDVS